MMRTSTLALALAFASATACGAPAATDPAPSAAPAAAATAEPAAQEPAAPAAPRPGTVTDATFSSPALGVDKRYFVYLPAGYADSTTRYPVVYMLHGLGGNENNWSRYMGLAKAADAMQLQAIVVMPDGDDSFYTNWVTDVDYDACLAGQRKFGKAPDMHTECVRTPRYEDYITVDLVGHVDSTYRTIADRRARSIGGLSMGGFGALKLAMRHPDLFGSVASHSGVAALLYAGPFPYERGKVTLTEDPRTWIKSAGDFGVLFGQIFGTDIANWRKHDPALLAANLSNGDLAIYIDCGTEDEFRLHNGAAYLHEVLEERGIEHYFELMPGRHSLEFWADRIDDSLAFHTAYWASAGAVAQTR